MILQIIGFLSCSAIIAYGCYYYQKEPASFEESTHARYLRNRYTNK